MEQLFWQVIAFFGALLLGLFGVPFMIRIAKKMWLFDVPDGRIKTHKEPVPYLGGVAIYIAFISIAVLIMPFESRLVWFLLGVTFLLFVGLVDDLHTLTPLQKLCGQIVAVLCFLFGGIFYKSQFLSGFWMLSVINAFNLVDVMDGLATTLAIISALTFFVISIALHDYVLSLLLLTLLGSLCAFFWYNKPSAKIYLGDAGSLFIGGFIAAISLLIPWETGFINTNLVLILFVGIPLLEVVSLIIIRRYKKIPFYSGSPHHFAIYLQNKKWNVWSVLIFTALNALLLSLLGLLCLFGVLSFYLVLAICVIFLLAWVKIVF